MSIKDLDINKRKYSCLFFMMGNNCNLHCTYCKQQEIHCKHPNFIMSDKLINRCIEFVKAHKIDSIRFSGGETLLYWDNVVKVVNRLESEIDYDLKYIIFTNGKLLDKEKLNFINNHDMLLSVSWDGKNSKELRGYDVLKDKFKLLLKAKRLQIISVITNKSYPYRDLLVPIKNFYNLYESIHKYPCHIDNEILINFYNGYNKDCIDPEELEKDVDKIIEVSKMYLNGDTDKKVFMDYNCSNYTTSNPAEYTIYDRACKGPYYIPVYMDTEGNIYDCPSASNIVNSIYNDNLDEELFKQFTFDDGRHDELCIDCDIKEICRNGCNIIPLYKGCIHCKTIQIMNKLNIRNEWNDDNNKNKTFK